MIQERKPGSILGAAALLVGATSLLLGSGCGKKGPPLPPLRHGPDRMTSVSAKQEGKGVVLTGLLPEHNQDGGPLANIVEVRVYRLDRGGMVGAPGASSKSFQRGAQKQFTKDAKRVAVLTGEKLANSRSGRRVTYLDPEPVEGAIPQAGKDFTYALTAVDDDKHASPLSPFAGIRLLPPPPAPSNLQVELSEKHIHLSWEPVQFSDHGATPAYNVYRTEVEGLYLGRPRNEHPLTQPVFEEVDFQFGVHYHYVVRTVLVSGNSSRESENSAPLEVMTKDVYAPAAPTGFAVSAEGGVLKLYWFPNQESDLAGYKIYRSESEAGEFQEIATVASTESIYIDKAVKPGVKYYYTITSMDSSNPPNESSRSDVRGDRLPPSVPETPKRKPGKP
jgi:hypothetical protein